MTFLTNFSVGTSRNVTIFTDIIRIMNVALQVSVRQIRENTKLTFLDLIEFKWFCIMQILPKIVNDLN